MRNYLLTIFVIVVCFSCKDKSQAKGGEEKAVINDFVASFPLTKLPFSITDTALNGNADTTTISYEVFKEFIPDTVLNNPFGKDRKLSFHPIGRFGEKNKEVYLTTLVKSKGRSAVYLLVLTRKNVFSASLPLLISGNDDNINSASIDSKLAITLQKEWKSNDEMVFNRSVYAYNNTGLFTVVLTETNDQSKLANDINNPLDTFPRKNKYSGDYAKSKLNFLTIRDGKQPNTYLFFVHFENEGDEPCNGEIKGEFALNSATTGLFTENGGSCVIDFSFTGNQVKVKEQGNCGSHRGIKCFFNDTYTKKKVAKSAAKDTKAPKRAGK